MKDKVSEHVKMGKNILRIKSLLCSNQVGSSSDVIVNCLEIRLASPILDGIQDSK